MKLNLKFEAEQVREIIQSYWEAFLYFLPKLIVAIFLLIIFLFIAWIIHRLVNRRIIAKMADPLLGRFVVRMVRFAIILIGLMIILNVLGLNRIAGGLLAGAGVTAIVLGFAFKDIGENFLSGIILAFSRPFRTGDTIELGDVMGTVMGLSLRNTRIKSIDGKDIFVPNARLIKENLINYTLDGFLRMDFIVGIDYDDNVAAATQLILKNFHKMEDILSDDRHKPFVIVDSLATSTVNLKIHFWVNTYDYSRRPMDIKSDAATNIKDALLKQGFELPADILELKHYKGDGFPVKMKKDL